MTQNRAGLDTLETGALLVAARAGDEAALAELISETLPVVYNFIGRALNGHADVDDLVQETMIRMLRGLPGLREPERFRSWVVAIAYRQVQLHLRGRRKLLLRRREVSAELPDPSGDFAERTVTELLLTGQRRELAAAARWLDDTDRQLLSLWWQEVSGELTRPELAAVLAVSVKHAAMRLTRMRTQLEAARAVVRALHAPERCADLEVLIHGWNGAASPLWRKRLVRHLRDCARCDRHRHGLVAPEKLLLGIAPLPVAVGLAATLPPSATAPSIWATLKGLLFNKIVVGATAGVVAVGGGGFAYTVNEMYTPDNTSVARGGPRSTGHPPGPTPAAAAGGADPAPRTMAALTGVTSADIYVAPDGSDLTGAGSAGHPYATLARAVAAVRPGQTIAMRGGTYRLDAPVTITTSGDATHRITVSNFRDERPVIDASPLPAEQWAVTQQADYWTVQGLEIKNSGSHAYVCRACRYDVFQRLSIHDNVRSALTLRDPGTVANQVLDSDFFNNRDPADLGRSGIGLGIKFGAGEDNLVRGNRAFNNADNGFDFGEFASPVTVERNWAYGNGINRWRLTGWQSNADGFHLGGGSPAPTAAHVLRNNTAWDNVNNGFTSSGNRGAMRLSNNTAFRNGKIGFFIPVPAATLLANAAAGNATAATVDASATLRGNAWADSDDEVALFRSTDPGSAEGRRAADGTLPSTDFLHSTTGIGATMSES